MYSKRCSVAHLNSSSGIRTLESAEHFLDRLQPALQTLLARAIEGEYAQDEVTAREVLTTVALICQPVRGRQPSFNQRMARVFMEGLKGGPLPANSAPLECKVRRPKACE
jgi:hypothetical protein